MGENLREMVNGAQLPQYIGKKVSIIGLINNVNPNGLTFDIKTTDDITVKINMKRPYTDVLEGHVEVHGTAQNKTVICDDLVQFPLEESADLDVTAYNTLCQLLQSVPDLWKTD